MTGRHNHTEEAIKQRGEVFTPDGLVSDMLDFFLGFHNTTTFSSSFC